MKTFIIIIVGLYLLPTMLSYLTMRMWMKDKDTGRATLEHLSMVFTPLFNILAIIAMVLDMVEGDRLNKFFGIKK